MKTAEDLKQEFIRNCLIPKREPEHSRYIQRLNERLDEYAEAYHAAQLSAGIKAKALRKRGTDEWYTEWLSEWMSGKEFLLSSMISAKTCKAYPKDAELVSVTIIVKGGEG